MENFSDCQYAKGGADRRSMADTTDEAPSIRDARVLNFENTRNTRVPMGYSICRFTGCKLPSCEDKAACAAKAEVPSRPMTGS